MMKNISRKWEFYKENINFNIHKLIDLIITILNKIYYLNYIINNISLIYLN